MSNTKKNLSILCTSLASGGAEKVISLFLKKLINDYNVTLVLFHNNIHFPVPKEVNIVYLNNVMSNKSWILKLIHPLMIIIRYNRLVRKENISISLSFLAFPNLVNGVVAMLNVKLKTIISERGFPSDNTSSKTSFYISKIFYPILYNRCDKLFSNSVHINKDLKDNFGVKIPMEVIYNPIEIQNKNIDIEKLAIPNNFFKIITVGTLNIRKNHMMIIRALHLDKSNYELRILGAGHLENQILENIKNLKLENHVSLKGKVKNVDDYLLDSHCFVLSSFTEGFPNALLEAMAVGLPCISTNCLSGPLEMLNDNLEVDIKQGDFVKAEYGILINNDDSEGLSKAMNFLRSNPEERVRYCKLSLIRSKEYNIKSIYPEFFQFINS